MYEVLYWSNVTHQYKMRERIAKDTKAFAPTTLYLSFVPSNEQCILSLATHLFVNPETTEQVNFRTRVNCKPDQTLSSVKSDWTLSTVVF